MYINSFFPLCFVFEKMKEGHILDKVIKEAKEFGEDKSEFLHEHPVIDAVHTSINQPEFRHDHPLVAKVEDVIQAIADVLEPNTPTSDK